MSSAKDYVLDITPSLDGKSVHSANLLKFTVRNRKDVLSQYKLPLLAVVGAALIGYLTQIVHLESYPRLDSDILNHIRPNQAIILASLFLIGLALLLKQTPEDSVTIIKDIGVQTVSKKAWKFQNSVECFIPLTDIIDLVVHEAFHNYGQVIFYLCVLTKPNPINKSSNENIIKVVFPEFLPRKDILLKVWKLSRDLLFGETRRYWRRVPGQGLKQI